MSHRKISDRARPIVENAVLYMASDRATWGPDDVTGRRRGTTTYGPLTNLPDDRYRQRIEIVGVVVCVMSGMDGILFPTCGAHSRGARHLLRLRRAPER